MQQFGPARSDGYDRSQDNELIAAIADIDPSILAGQDVGEGFVGALPEVVVDFDPSGAVRSVKVVQATFEPRRPRTVEPLFGRLRRASKNARERVPEQRDRSMSD